MRFVTSSKVGPRRGEGGWSDGRGKNASKRRGLVLGGVCVRNGYASEETTLRTRMKAARRCVNPEERDVKVGA